MTDVAASQDPVKRDGTIVSITVRYTEAQVAVIHALFERPDLLAALNGTDDEDLEASLPEAMRSLVALRALELVDPDQDPDPDDAAVDDDLPEPTEAVRLLDPHLMVIEVVLAPDRLVAIAHDGDDPDVAWFVKGDRAVRHEQVGTGVLELTIGSSAGVGDRVVEALGLLDAPPADAEERTEATVSGKEVERLQRGVEQGDRERIVRALGDDAPAGLVDALVDPVAAGQLTVLAVTADGGSVDGEHWSFVHGGDAGWWLVDGVPGFDDGTSADGAEPEPEPVVLRRCGADDAVALLGLADDVR